MGEPAPAEPDVTSECILWTGYVMPNGYGQRRFAGKVVTAHRAAWIEAHGDIPSGIDVCHACDVRSCVNIDHLFLGTRSENMLDASTKGRINNGQSSKTECPSGHPYNERNTRYTTEGWRVCHACRMAKQKRVRLERKARNG